MKYTSATDTGKVRKNNEDYLAVKSVGQDHIFVIADGMGGHAVGELASRTAVEYVISALPRELESAKSAKEIENVLKLVVEKANVRVYLESLDNKDFTGMGTTLTVAVIRDWRLYLSHIGDCRVYQLHGSTMDRLTEDHTLVQVLVDSGSITEEEAVTHPKRHVLIKSLGVNEYMSPDTYSFDISEGDLILMCSDGLYGYVGENEIRSVLRRHKDLEACASQLVDAANREGGKDNVTVILIHCDWEKNKEIV